MDTMLRVRCSDDLVKRLDDAAEKLSPPGVKLTRSDVVRMALETALPDLVKRAGRERRGRK